MGDASPESIVQSTEKRGGLSKSVDSPSLSSLAREVFEDLDRGVASLQTDTNRGQLWPRPRIETIAALVARYPAEVCRKASAEAREIAQAQDRAPSITGLFKKKLADIAAEDQCRAEVRETIRESIAEAA